MTADMLATAFARGVMAGVAVATVIVVSMALAGLYQDWRNR